MRKITSLLIALLFLQLNVIANTELKIEHWRPNQGLPPATILSMGQDELGYILLYTTNGVHRFDGANSSHCNSAVSPESQTKFSIQNNDLFHNGTKFLENINSFLETQNEVWVGGILGFGTVDLVNKNVAWLKPDGPLSELSCSNLVLSDDNKIWFSMPLMGIGFYDIEKKKFFSIQNIDEYVDYTNAHDVFSILLDRSISSLFFDTYNNLWVATRSDGLYKISFNQQRYQFFRSEFEKEAGLLHRDISFPLATIGGDVWISSWGGGINIWDKDELYSNHPNFRDIPLVLPNNKKIPDLRIYPLMEDSKQNIWIGTRSGGLYMLSSAQRKSETYKYKVFSIEAGTLPDNEISSLCEGANNEIWCGTYSGLIRIDAKHNYSTLFKNLAKPDMFEQTRISMLKYTHDNKLWIGAWDGMLYRWNMLTSEVDSFQLAKNTQSVRAYGHANLDGIDWFVSSGGLFYYDHIDHTTRFFSKNHLLPRIAESLLADDFGHLWVGSSAGLFKVDPLTNEVKKIDLEKGTMGINFTQGASKDKNGYLYFGSRYGFYRFHPNKIDAEPDNVPVLVRGMGISGEAYTLEALKDLPGWNEKGQAFLRLKHHQNTVSFNFVKLNFNKEDDSLFEIMLEGNNETWVETSDKQRSWSGLKPGTYSFKVREKGQENYAQFSFEITAPWWIRWLAILAYLILSFMGVIFFYRFTSKRAKEKEKRRQKEKYEQLRFRFFLNISHEIRTPLTLISGAIDRLVEKEDSVQNKELKRIKHNTGRLIRMVNEVLDLKKIEQSEVEVKNVYFNLKEFLVSTVDAFRLREDKCAISLSAVQSPVWINTSRELLETILYNLLSNAIKFSDEKGKVEVALATNENTCTISVKDYGVGIDAKEHEKIFERFYKQTNNPEYGAGIGLSLVKEFVETLNGEISLKSKPGEGSEFIVTLPLESARKDETKPKNGRSNNENTILIVDDHADIRAFIAEIFAGEYTCLEAENGKQALEVIKEQPPVFVISDVMMPEMNGFQLCQRVKENIETSHIPILLLTAKTDLDAELKAAECSADDFVSKPFNQKLLKAKVLRIIEQRQKLRKLFGSIEPMESNGAKISQIDSEFIAKIEQTILSNIDNPELSVEELAQSVALSSSGLYRKIKALSNQSPIEFIRTIRLKEAAKMLKSTGKSVSEIADHTGFGTQKYFSRCFKQKFGLSPLQYRKQE